MQYGGIVQYSFDAESRISAISGQGVTTPFETYVYGAGGTRVRKTNADGTFTEYVDFGGQPIAEKDQTGAWTDYIYADGKKIARVAATVPLLHLYGSLPQSGSECGASVAQGVNYLVKSGDKLSWIEYKNHAVGGLMQWFDNFSLGDQWRAVDTNGYTVNQDTRLNQWVTRTVDLSSYAGHTLNGLGALMDVWTQPGSWDIWYGDISIVSTDGTVTPIMGSSGALSGIGAAGPCQGPGTVAVELQTVGTAPGIVGSGADTHFYLGDHLGTAQMEFASGGWPVWQGQFAPYGQELDTQTTANHYKFTGKERDTESGLDYFGARYYASNMGRWMSPDWAAKAQPVPYAKLDNPQSLNLYGYVLNNPLSKVDADGHDLTVTGDKQKDYIAYAQKASGLTFAADKNGKISITASPKDISALGKSFTKLINDTENHVSISAQGATPGVFVGQFDGNGHQTLNFQNINALDGKGGFSGAAAVTHETFEAYFSSQGMGFGAAHAGGLSYEGTERTQEGGPSEN